MNSFERAARALSQEVAFRPWDEMAKDRADLRSRFRDGDNLDINEPTQSDCWDAALAVLRAVREASPDMIEAMMNVEFDNNHHAFYSEEFAAAIDALIAQGGGDGLHFD